MHSVHDWPSKYQQSADELSHIDLCCCCFVNEHLQYCAVTVLECSSWKWRERAPVLFWLDLHFAAALCPVYPPHVRI